MISEKFFDLRISQSLLIFLGNIPEFCGEFFLSVVHIFHSSLAASAPIRQKPPIPNHEKNSPYASLLWQRSDCRL